MHLSRRLRNTSSPAAKKRVRLCFGTRCRRSGQVDLVHIWAKW